MLYTTHESSSGHWKKNLKNINFDKLKTCVIKKVSRRTLNRHPWFNSFPSYDIMVDNLGIFYSRSIANLTSILRKLSLINFVQNLKNLKYPRSLCQRLSHWKRYILVLLWIVVVLVVTIFIKVWTELFLNIDLRFVYILIIRVKTRTSFRWWKFIMVWSFYS